MAGDVYYLGIDGGGTGCRARLTDAAGQIVGGSAAGPATLRLGAEAVWTELMLAASLALGEAGLDDSDAPVHVAAAVAGTSRKSALDALQSRPHVFASLTIVGDAHAACLGAHAGADGGIVIAGTGAIGYGLVDGNRVQVGGYGFPISDRGSGADLGLEALRAALNALDGFAPETPLTTEILARFDRDTAKITAWMDRATATDYASVAEPVVRNAAGGDAVARGLLQAAAAHIDRLVVGLNDRGISKIAMLGGLAPVLETWLQADQRARLHAPKGDAIDGALLVARQAVAA
jgi:glucosamine kinase